MISKPKGMSINIEHKTEGPKHDPYGFDIWNIRMKAGDRVNYRSEGLAPASFVMKDKAGNIMIQATGKTADDLFEKYVADFDVAMEWVEAEYVEDPIRF